MATSIRDQVARDHTDDDERWFEQFDECARVLVEEGALPEDSLLRDAVLASQEFVALLEAGAAERATKLAELQADASRRLDRPPTD